MVHGAAASAGLAGRVDRARRSRESIRTPGASYQALEQAQWIWDTAGAQSRAPAGDRYFRAAFTVPAGRRVKRAIAVIGADNRCDVYFNGEKSGGRVGCDDAGGSRCHGTGARRREHDRGAWRATRARTLRRD